MRSAIGWAVGLVSVITVRVLSDHIAPLQSLHTSFALYRISLVALTISLTLCGFVIAFGPLFLKLLSGEGRSMGRDEMLEMDRRGVIGQRPGWSVSWFRGKMRGSEMASVWTFADIKLAFQTGSWRTDPQSRRQVVSFIGMMLMIFGGFGIGFVAGPAWLTLLLGLVLLYTAVQIGRAIARA